MQITITARAAKSILTEHGLTVDQLKRAGRLDLKPCVFITFRGKCRYTLVDHSSAEGEGIADLVPVYDRPLIPAWTTDADGTTRAHRLEDRAEADRLHAVRRALLVG